MFKRALWLFPVLALASLTQAQTTRTAAGCVRLSGGQMIIYRAGSLTRAFKPIIEAFTCRTGVEVKDNPMGSVDAGRQITAGGKACDLYAPADYLDIDLFMKPAGYADFNIVFAHGRMVLTYSASGLTAKKLPPIEAAGSGPFHPPDSIPGAAPNWYQILAMPNVVIGGGNWFLDPGAYRAPMIFQLAEAFYKVPNLYNDLLGRIVIPGQQAGARLGKELDFQFTYEHNARATAMANPDFRYVDLPAEINLSDPAKDAWYAQNAIVVLPGLGTSRSVKTIPVPAAHVAWGITLMKDAPNKENAIKFLELLLGAEGNRSLKENGPDPLTPALVSAGDLRKLPASLQRLVKVSGK